MNGTTRKATTEAGRAGAHAGLRPEAQLLLDCAAWTEGMPTCWIERSVEAVEDWKLAIESAQENRVTPQLYRGLDAIGWESTPTWARREITAIVQACALHNMNLMGELAEVTRLFAREGIDAVSYKGPVLASWLYGNVAYRQTWDLDLLVRPEELGRARELVLERGYVPEDGATTMSEAGLAALIRRDCESNFDHPRTKTHLELHWRVLPAKHSREFRDEQIWDHLEEFGAPVEGLKTIEPKMLFLVLCLHGGEKHQWGRMRWIVDLARFVLVHGRCDWNWIAEQARRMRLTRAVCLGLYLAKALFDSPIPPPWRAEIRADPAVAELAGLVRGRLFRRDMGLPGYREWMSYVKAHEGGYGAVERPMEAMASRWRYFRAVTAPEWQDRERLPRLPACFGFLPYCVRPLRLIGRHRAELIKRTV
jgi:hypothetical protein